MNTKMITLRIIKYLATSGVALMVVAEAYLMIVRPDDDIAGGVFMGLLGIALFGLISIAAARSERRLQNRVSA